MELTEFFPGTGFVVYGQGETEWGSALGKEEVDLTEGDWAGFDEETQDAVGIYEFKSQFVKSTKK